MLTMRMWVAIGALLLSLCLPRAVEAAEGVESQALLQQGRAGPYRWQLLIRQWKAERDKGFPCIGVSVAPVGAVESGKIYTLCGNPDPSPLVMKVANDLANGTSSYVAGMVFEPAARLIEVKMSDGRVLRRRPRLMSDADARKAGVEKRLRYLTLAYVGTERITKVIPLDAGGSSLLPVP